MLISYDTPSLLLASILSVSGVAAVAWKEVTRATSPSALAEGGSGDAFKAFFFTAIRDNPLSFKAFFFIAIRDNPLRLRDYMSTSHGTDRIPATCIVSRAFIGLLY